MKQSILFQKQNYPLLTAGIDEAGRGAWAGPVVAAAVILQGKDIRGIDDSKALSPRERERLFEKIMERCIVGVGMRPACFVDSDGIKKATWESMKDAVQMLSIKPEFLLVDGNDRFFFDIPHESIIRGDSLIKAIGAASIIAKVTRDRLMVDLAKIEDNYGFEKHKGYGTALHQKRILKYGLFSEHRKTYIHTENFS